MIIVVKGCDCDIVCSSEDRIIEVVKLHDDLLLGAKKSIPDGHVFLEIPEDAGSDWHGGGGSPYFDVTKK